MFKIQKINNLSPLGLDRFPVANYELATDTASPDAIMLRSQKLHDMKFDDNLKAIGRAGAGVNNIPVERLTQLGVPVFNAPGANANAVKELVIASLFLAERNLYQAVAYTKSLTSEGAALDKEVEDGKKRFVGRELPGRTLGVIGLGAIGVEVANTAVALGMEVIGFDPAITVTSAWQLSSAVEKANSVDEVLSRSEFVTFHVPLLDATRHMINPQRLHGMRDGTVVLNFARAGVVDDDAILSGLESGKIKTYVCDFPTQQTISHENVITLPHLGASTAEAEENCAIMVADQLRDFLEHGNIRNCVNFPTVELSRKSEFRLALIHRNVPDMVGQISHQLGVSKINICHMINESHQHVACTLIDTEVAVPDETMEAIRAIEGLLKARRI
ncbi:3-phosphoglycerate dehydrogenase [Chromatiales bacterium (ex Bugula neritina AB1)]|nr:3-phosphoglycerate dehydrogenase [Chromatiales bacterium (ex Bugula neritina AB1)]